MLRAEIETIVRWDKTNDPASYYTCERRLARKLEKVGLKPIEVDTDSDGKPRSWRFEVPRDWLRVKVRPKRRMTEAQLQNIKKAQAARRTRLAAEVV